MSRSMKREVPRIAAELGLPEIPEQWSGIDVVWPLLERMREEGAVVIVKLDGERTKPGDSGPYTVMISGGGLGRDATRTDKRSLEEALAAMIVEYARRAWGYGERGEA